MDHGASKVHKLTLTAILMAIIFIMSYTPLGYLRAGAVEITFLTIPVVIGAIVLGPWYGAFLGAVFGATSFAQCFSTSIFGAALLALDPAATFITCMVPRILIGVVSGYLFRWIYRIDRTGILPAILSAVSGALTNTVFFVGLVVLFFQDSYFGGSGVWTIVLGFFTFNAALEIVACGLLGAGLSKVLVRFLPRERSAS